MRIPQGSNIVKPSIVRGELIAIYGTLIDLGICQNLDTFAANVVCQRNVTDVNRLDVIFPADLIDQLNIVVILLQFTP